jgi:hypothetical protein
MLSRKKSFLLNTIVISFLMSGSHTTLGKVSDSWEKMASQPTESQKAADAARAEREKELQAIRDSKKEPTSEEKTLLEPMKKPAEASESTPTKPHVSHTPSATSSPVQKRRTMQEQIALNKQKKAEDLHKLQEMNKEKAAALSTAKHTAKSEKEIAMSPSQKKLASDLDKKAADETMKMGSEESKKPTTTSHPAVDLALPPLKMHIEEHEEITLSMPKKEEAKPVTQQADTKVEAVKIPSPPAMPKSSTTQSNIGTTSPARGDLLAQIQKGTALRKTAPQAQSE